LVSRVVLLLVNIMKKRATTRMLHMMTTQIMAMTHMIRTMLMHRMDLTNLVGSLLRH
jgi:hypothetical protein